MRANGYRKLQSHYSFLLMMQTDLEIHSPISTLCGIPTPPGAVVLANRKLVEQAIERLASAIGPFVDASPEDPVVLVALLEGGRFYADRLQKLLERTCAVRPDRIDIKVSTRDGDGRPLTTPLIVGDLGALQGRRVLIVDDILDSGVTLRLTNDRLRSVAAELKTTVLIQKDEPTLNTSGTDLRPKADFVGLVFSDTRWFSGAGMDMPGDPAGVARHSETIIAYPPLF